jgi:uncharacterized protein (DUF58 family)
MNWLNRTTEWLETRWVNPSYSGWLLSCLAIFLFVAATNTMAGWLYVMSGVMLSLLLVAAILSYRNLKSLQVRRSSIEPITVGEPIEISLSLMNASPEPKGLLQIYDRLPPELGSQLPQTIETVPAQGRHTLTYSIPTTRRGIYRWQNVEVRTAAPFGLFWRRRSWPERISAIVYPQILPLKRCPILDEMGRDRSLQVLDNRRSQASNEGMTRSLRPYRWGDPMRMIHWSTSARHGELRVREMERMTSGREVVICLDSSAIWEREAFEAAVTTATSLYFYAVKQQLNVCLWTAHTGKLRGAQQVLQTLAGVMPGQATPIEQPPQEPLIWLTQNLNSLNDLPNGSRWLLWQDNPVVLNLSLNLKGMVINATEQPLEHQLQKPM